MHVISKKPFSFDMPSIIKETFASLDNFKYKDQSALLADIVPRQLSFKHTLQLWLAWSQQGAHIDHEVH